MVDQRRTVDEDVDEIELLTRPGREEELRTFLLLLHPVDVGELLDYVDDTVARAILRHLDAERAAQLVSELEPLERERLVTLMRTDELAPIVGEMETDDVADLLQDLDEDKARELLSTLSVADRVDVAKLLRYDPKTAGGLMQTELVTISIQSTVGAAIEKVRRAGHTIDILSIFVVDDARHYAGHVALQDLVLSTPETPIEQIMEPKVVEITPNVDQEEVARIFDRYSLVEVGVVDGDGKLVGRITADDVHEVLVEEAEEDMLKLAGTLAEPSVIHSGGLLETVWRRLPWLVTTLLAQLVVAYVNENETFRTIVTLMAFTPLVAGLGGSVGNQSAMIMLSGVLAGHIDTRMMLRRIGRDTLVGILLGVSCGLVVTGFVLLWHDPRLALCVGVSVALAMTAGGVLGASEPAILRRAGVDPTLAAGHFVTSLNYVAATLVYVMTAKLMLSA